MRNFNKSITQIKPDNLPTIERSIEDFKEAQNSATSNHIKLLKRQEN